MKNLQSKIEKLIADLCPEGVEFRKLGEVCSIRTGQATNDAASIEGNEMPKL